MERKLTTIFAADVAGYAHLMGVDEERAHAAFRVSYGIIDKVIARHGGRIFGGSGDSIMAEFASPVEALRAAVEMQAELEKTPLDLPPGERMRFRVGVNLGDVMVDDGDLNGDGVNVAARLESAADPGGIMISENVYDHVRNRGDLDFEDLGRQTLKNIVEPVRIFRVKCGAGAPRSFKPLAWLRRRRTLALAAAALVVAALVALGRDRAGILRLPSSETSIDKLSIPDQPSIAVLPFDNLSGDPGQEYFSDGLTSDLTTDLSKLGGLFVIASNSAFTFKGKPVKVQDVSRELGVRYILEGSVQRVGSVVRVNAQLIDAVKGHHLWAERYDREFTGVFSIQDEIITLIVKSLAVAVSAAERERVMANQTDNVEAYELWLRGRAIFSVSTSKKENQEAQQLFREATELDPTFADAYAHLARTYIEEWRQNWGAGTPEASLQQAKLIAQQAVDAGKAKNLDNANAHASLAIVYLSEGDFPNAVAEFTTSQQIDKTDPDLVAEMGFAFVYLDREADAIAQLLEAIRLHPKRPWWYDSILGWAYHQNHEYQQAVDALTAVDPIENTMRLTLAASYARLGDLDRAHDEIEIFLLNEEWTIKDETGAPFVNPDDEKHWLDGLRLAGLPEG